MKAKGLRQLYLTVSVPGITYGAEVWYTAIHQPSGHARKKGSVAITNKIRSTQRKVAKTITGALATTAGDVLDVHAFLLPIDLMFRKVQFRAASRICALPASHPLHKVVRKAANRLVKRHRSPLHNLLYSSRLRPSEVETITPTRRSPSYRPVFDCIRLEDKDKALEAAEALHSSCRYKIYCDGSGLEKKIGALALLYIGNRLSKTLHFHLGSEDKHTVYEAESVGLLMGLHMLNNVSLQLHGTVLLGSDSQALSRALGNQSAHPGQYLIDEIHTMAEHLQVKQDGIINAAEKRASVRSGENWKGRKRGVIDLQLHWIPAHSDFEPNERADEEAKRAAQGLSSDAKLLPKILRRSLPASVPALRQDHDNRLLKRWKRRWKSSPRHRALHPLDDSIPSRKYLHLTQDLERRQASLLIQLRTGHIGLNQHLFRIRKAETPTCPHCRGITVETVKHFLLVCPKYAHERHQLRHQLRRKADSLPFLLSSPAAIKPLLKFVNSTGRFHSTFGNLESTL